MIQGLEKSQIMPCFHRAWLCECRVHATTTSISEHLTTRFCELAQIFCLGLCASTMDKWAT